MADTCDGWCAQEVSSSTFFINLYQRPVQGNPVVALKGLITTLKLLQQGPRDFLSECVRTPTTTTCGPLHPASQLATA